MKVSDLLTRYKSDKDHGNVVNIYNNLDDRVVVPDAEPKMGHTYGPVYDELFGKYTKDSDISILEIGTQKGGSILAYRDYFPNASLYGVDIIDCVLPEFRREDINYIFHDVKSDQALEKISSNLYDIIIDDGSHFLPDVMYVVVNFLKLLKPNGTLLIEDCQQPEAWVYHIQSALPPGYSLEVKDLREGNTYDNFIILIKNTQ